LTGPARGRLLTLAVGMEECSRPRVEQKNRTYLNNIQRDHQSSPNPTPSARIWNLSWPPITLRHLCADSDSHSHGMKLTPLSRSKNPERSMPQALTHSHSFAVLAVRVGAEARSFTTLAALSAQERAHRPSRSRARGERVGHTDPAATSRRCATVQPHLPSTSVISCPAEARFSGWPGGRSPTCSTLRPTSLSLPQGPFSIRPWRGLNETLRGLSTNQESGGRHQMEMS